MEKSIKFAVVLAGCGVYDGAEIHETVMSLWAIERNGASYQAFAPDRKQYHVINHITGAEMLENRNVMIEAARIVRGKILPLPSFDASEFDVLLFPGGFGVAKNLCDFAFKAAAMGVQKDVEDVVLQMHTAKKPIGALCISPILLAKIISNSTLTLGGESQASKIAQQFGAIHQATSHGEIVVDEANKLVSSPCYMLDASIQNIADGADKTVKALIAMV